MKTPTEWLNGSDCRHAAFAPRRNNIEVLEDRIAPAALVISGTAGDDLLTVIAASADSGTYQLNDGPAVSFSGVTKFEFGGGDGDDTLTIVNPDGSVFAPADGIVYEGQAHRTATGDTLVLSGGGGADFGETWILGATPDKGTIIFSDGSLSQVVNYSGLEPVVDTVAAATLTVTGTNASNAITYTVGSLNTRGLVAVDNNETIEFANKTMLIINALGGDDTVTLNNANVPAGLTTINVDAGEGTDQVVVETAGAADTAVFTPTAVYSATLAITSLGLSSTLTRVENVVYRNTHASGLDNLTINGSFSDTTDYSAATFAGSFRSLLSPAFDFSLVGRLTVNAGSGSGDFDVVNITGSAGDDLVTSTASAITVDTPGTLAIVTLGAGIDQVNLSMLDGNDNIDLDLNVTGLRLRVDAGAGNDTVNLLGTTDTTILGGDGDDILTGSSTADLIYGGAGNDVLVGGGGADIEHGEDGNDIFGNPSTTTNGVADDMGTDQFFGGAGSDRFFWEPGDGDDVIEGGAGDSDQLFFFGNAGAEQFFLFADAVTPARFHLFRVQAAIDIDAGDLEEVNLATLGGTDTVTVGRSDLGVLSDLSTTTVRAVDVALGSDAAVDSVIFEGRAANDNLLVSLSGATVKVAGGSYNLRIDGSDAALDRLTVNGNDGDDLLDASGTTGGISLNGGAGNDLLLGGSGDDTLDGGSGDDTFVGNGGTDNVGGGAGSSLGDAILLPGGAGSDAFALALDATGRLLATVNGVTTTYGNFLAGPIANSGIELIAVQGVAGADGLTLTNTNGAIVIPIHFDGGDNADALTLTGGTATSDTFSPGSNPGEGTSAMVIGGVTQVVTFSGVEAAIDLVAGPLVIDANDASNAISYAVGRNNANTANDTTRGKVNVDAQTFINFSSKTMLTINGLAGDDTINLSNPNTPTGLTSITVNGGNASVNDRLVIAGTTGGDTFTFAGTSATDGTVTISGAAPVAYSNTKNVVLDGLAGADTFLLASAKGAVEIHGGDDADTVNFTGATTGVILDLDLLDTPQRVNSTGEIIRLADAIENFIGTSFNDILYIRAASFPRALNGGAQTTLQPGDTLVFSGASAVVNIQPADTNTGTVKTVGFANAGYDEFETRTIVNSPSGPAGFGTPASSEAFSTATIYDPTLFTNGTKPAPGKGPTAVATGDLDGNGFADLVVVNSKTANLSVLISKGDGTFFDPVNLSAGTTNPQDLVLGDFDGDTILDAVLTFPKAAKFAFFKGDGAGGFAAPVATATPKFKPFAVAAADLDGDLDLDLAVTSRDSHTIAIMLSDGAGTFAVGAPIKALGKQPVDIIIADFNSDGSLDVAAANAGSNNINLFRGDGLGGVATPERFAVGVRPSGLAAGDLDNDGDIDLAVSNSISRFVSVLLSAGNVASGSQFAPQLRVALPGQHQASAIAIGDVDGNGVADIGLGNGLGTKFTVLRGIGDAIYSQPYDFDLGKDTKPNITTAIALADLNHDGLLDVIVTSVASNDLRVLLRKF